MHEKSKIAPSDVTTRTLYATPDVKLRPVKDNVTVQPGALTLRPDEHPGKQRLGVQTTGWPAMKKSSSAI
jgi:hypothetical protein